MAPKRTHTDELDRWREGLSHALSGGDSRRPLRKIAVALLIVVIAGIGGGYVYWRSVSGLFRRTTVVLDPATGNTLNFLLVGSDSRDGLGSSEDVNMFGTVGGQRADTIILAQIVPTQQRGVLVHLPRDLWVTVHANGSTSKSKINAAYAKGPQALVDTVRALTRMPVNHYMEINISGFRSMVDAIGGIEVTLDEAIYDSKLRFSLPAGTSHLNGNLALSFVRARHATPDGDFGRIRRQQEFIRAVIGKVGNPSVLGNPIRVNELARAFARNITVDQDLQLPDLVRFALSVRRVGPDQLLTYRVPGRSGRVGSQSVVVVDDEKAEILFEALRQGRDPSGLISSQAYG